MGSEPERLSPRKEQSPSWVAVEIETASLFLQSSLHSYWNVRPFDTVFVIASGHCTRTLEKEVENNADLLFGPSSSETC